MGKSNDGPRKAPAWPVAIAVAIALCAAAGVAVIAHRTSVYERAFDAASTGDSITVVISRFGEPLHRELRGKLWSRYATVACAAPCAQRLWWEHPIFRSVEAWSVEFDDQGRVLNKSHWISP